MPTPLPEHGAAHVAAPDDAPVSAPEFARLMAPLGPFAPNRAVIVAVSGGPDSMALAHLLAAWGEPLAIVVDHGLRPAAAAEAALTLARLQALSIPARLVRLGLAAGAGQGARARDARYAALLAACRAEGRPDLLVAHHARDQAETLLIRRARATGPAGEAAMPAIAWRADARILRPLLAIHPGRLRATLRAAGIAWVEDPSNANPATPRGALRARPIPVDALAAEAGRAGHLRRRREDATALAAAVEISPAGHAVLRGDIPPADAARLIGALSGRPYDPAPAPAARALRGATLQGMQARASLLFREPAAMQTGFDPAAWDSRFALRHPAPGLAIGPLGDAASGFRDRSPHPAALLRSSPAVRLGTELLPATHLAYHGAASWPTVQVDFRPPRPAAGAPFHPAVLPGV